MERQRAGAGRQPQGRQVQTRQRMAPMDRNQAYVEGNTVRKLNPQPLERPERQKEPQKPQKPKADRAVRANRARAMQMGPGYMLFLTVAVGMTVLICALYVHLQSNISTRMRHISSLEGQVMELQMDNDAAMKRVEASVDLDEVKRRAMDELGMVYPTEDQIVYFKVDTDDYMNQYQDIPGQ